MARAKNKRGISDRHARVLDHYFSNGLKQREALRATHYSEKTVINGQNTVFGRADVKAEIARRAEKLEQKSDRGRDWIIQKLENVIDFSVPDAFIIHEDGTVELDLAKLNDKQRAAVGSLEVTSHGLGREKRTNVKFKGRDFIGAITLLSRIHGILDDKLTVVDGKEMMDRLNAGRKRTEKKE